MANKVIFPTHPECIIHASVGISESGSRIAEEINYSCNLKMCDLTTVSRLIVFQLEFAFI